MLEQFTGKNDKYLSYAYTICKCHDQKHDLVNEMYLKLYDILKNEPSKEISDGYIYLMLKTIFINGIRNKKEYAVDMGSYIAIAENDQVLEDRNRLNDMINKLPFFDREILLRCQETSRRKLAIELDVSVQTICNYERKAKEKLKSILNK